jgi:hypothetical protein
MTSCSFAPSNGSTGQLGRATREQSNNADENIFEKEEDQDPIYKLRMGRSGGAWTHAESVHEAFPLVWYSA